METARRDPQRASRSRTKTIIRERLHAARMLRDDPGLRPRRQELFESADADARKEAAGETGPPLRAMPEAAAFTLAQITDEASWAEPPRG